MGNMSCIVSELAQILRKLNLTISSAESCTGGYIAHMLTERSGSSAYYKGSVISYCNEIKIRVLGVKKASIDADTEVSEDVATDMAMGVMRLMNTDVSVSTTGIAGPTGALPGKPIGTVYISACTKCGHMTRRYVFEGDREAVIEQAAETALDMALDLLRQECAYVQLNRRDLT